MQQRKRNSRRTFPKSALLLASLAALLWGCVGSTLAWLVAGTDSLVNTFEPGRVSSTVVEGWPNEGEPKKTDVCIKNTGNTDAYIRAYVSVCWKNGEGEIYNTAPVLGTDYSISSYNETDWVKIGDYWYHKTKVAPEASTAPLFTSCTYLKNAPAGYGLAVEIIADAIQSNPKDAVEQSWPVTVSESGQIGGTA